MNITDPEGAEILRRCLADPADMNGPLVLADWIDAAYGGVRCTAHPEPDDCEPHPSDLPCRRCRGCGWLPHPRAEFIRVQCACEALPRDADTCLCGYAPRDGYHHNSPSCPFVRCEELLRTHEAEWRRAGACEACKGTGREWGSRRWCVACDCSGDKGGLLRRFAYHHPDYGHAGPSEPVRAHFRRGLLDRVEVPMLADCFERCDPYSHMAGLEWRPTPWLRAVLTHHPTVTQVVPLDRVPAPESVRVRVGFFWLREVDDMPLQPHHLPAPIFDALDGGVVKQVLGAITKTYHTREAAVAAIGRAVVTVARNLCASTS